MGDSIHFANWSSRKTEFTGTPMQAKVENVRCCGSISPQSKVF